MIQKDGPVIEVFGEFESRARDFIFENCEFKLH